MTIKLTDYGIGEFAIDNVIFNIPIAQEIGRPKESPSIVGQLVLLGQFPNQMLFIYHGTIEPPILPLPQINEGIFCNSLEYLSSDARLFIQRYFDRCH